MVGAGSSRPCIASVTDLAQRVKVFWNKLRYKRCDKILTEAARTKRENGGMLRGEMTMYDYKCEYCDGTVREKIVKREAFKFKNGFVILEDVPIGVCDTCGTRYYHASLLKRVVEIAEGKMKQEKIEQAAVAQFADWDGEGGGYGH